MSDRDRSKAINPNYTSKSETERVFDVFNSFQRDAKEINSISTSKDTDKTSPVLTMSSIGQLGRFGNQLFQYAYLRICAAQSGAKVECPPWIGQTLFGHQDAPISQRLPPAIEQKEEEQTLFDVIPEFIIYFPQNRLKGLAIRAYLGYQIQGITGVIKSFLNILGWRTWQR
jgi:hypothetical protein